MMIGFPDVVAPVPKGPDPGLIPEDRYWIQGWPEGEPQPTHPQRTRACKPGSSWSSTYRMCVPDAPASGGPIHILSEPDIRLDPREWTPNGFAAPAAPAVTERRSAPAIFPAPPVTAPAAVLASQYTAVAGEAPAQLGVIPGLSNTYLMIGAAVIAAFYMMRRVKT
jgi:hypothetical protein